MSIVPFVKKNNLGAAYQTRREVDTLLDNLFNSSWVIPFESDKTSSDLFMSPLWDISEDDAGFKISMELPGLKDSEVDVSIDDNVLTVKGEKQKSEEDKGRNYYYAERSYGSFERSIRLPDNVKIDDIAASFNNGVLEILVPKKPKSPSTVKKIVLKK